MKKETFMDFFKQTSSKQKLLAFGIVALLTIGALGAVDEFSGNKNGGIISSLGESVGLKKRETVSIKPLPQPTGTLQLSKEYVYAGSKMLATEDYGIAQPNPTPTP